MESFEDAIDKAQAAVNEVVTTPAERAARLLTLGNLFKERFKRDGCLQDLDNAIKETNKAVVLFPKSDQNYVTTLKDLCITLVWRCSKSNSMGNLEEAIITTRATIAVLREGNLEPSLELSNLGTMLKNRFDQLRLRQDLDDALQAIQQALRSMPHDDPNLPTCLGNLANVVLTQVEVYGRSKDVQESIRLVRTVANAAPNSTDLSNWYARLGHALISYYKRSGDMDDLSAAIETSQNALDSTVNNTFCFWNAQFVLGDRLELRYRRLGSCEDLSEAIRLAESVAKALENDHKCLPVVLQSLASRLSLRYNKYGDLKDLEEAIEVFNKLVNIASDDGSLLLQGRDSLKQLMGQELDRRGGDEYLHKALITAREATEATSISSFKRSICLNLLGTILVARFERLNALEDLEEAIQTGREAIAIAPKDRPDLMRRLVNDLVDCLTHRYKRWHCLDDLQEAINILRRAVKSTPDDSAELQPLATNLGVKLAVMFDQNGLPETLEESTQVFNKALAALQKGSMQFAGLLSNIGCNHSRRYQAMGAVTDLEQAVCLGRKAMIATNDSDPNLAMVLQNLSFNLQLRFKRFGKLEDLEEAIKLIKKGIRMSADDSNALSNSLNTLGMQLGLRFYRLKCLNDLDEATDVLRKAVELTSDHDLDLAARLNNLGNSLHNRYFRSFRLQDLDEAIHFVRRAIALTMEGSRHYAAYLNNLGTKLSAKSQRLRADASLEEAIINLTESLNVQRRSVEATSKHDLDYASRLNNLGSTLQQLFEVSKKPDDLEEALRFVKQSIAAMPEESVYGAKFLKILGSIHIARFDLYSDQTDEDAAVLAFRKAYDCVFADPSDRFIAARMLLNLQKYRKKWRDAAEIAGSALRLLPLMQTHNQGLRDQQYTLSFFQGLAADACALHLQTEKQTQGAVEVALELLELGRGAIASVVMEAQTDITELRSSYPELADEFERLQFVVNRTPEAFPTSGPILLETIRKRNQLIESIRQLEGFHRFLMAPSVTEMKAAAAGGYVILINVSQIRSDAIVVSEKRVDIVPLPHLHYGACTENKTIFTYKSKRKDYGEWGRHNKPYRECLFWLWEACVAPILTFLQIGFHHSMPRIWWIPTGVASSLPLHAAGDLILDSGNNTMERVVSSYTPSIKSLILARARVEKKNRNEYLSGRKEVSRRLLLVTMSTTPGEDDLPWVEPEAAVVQQTMGLFSITRMNNPTASEVANALYSHDFVHLACHGISHPEDPIHSSLLLQSGHAKPVGDGLIQDPLTVQQLMQMQSSSSSQLAQLAYLSACSTAENKVAALADEAIHIASAFFVGGFPHVIGSLQPSVDVICVRIAENFYRNVALAYSLRSEYDYARALHDAVLQVRSDKPKIPLLWSQYIHIGP